MPVSTQIVEDKDFSEPDEVRHFKNGRVELLNMQGGVIGRLVPQPGWRWSNDVKPIAGTDWCGAPHFQYQASGRIHFAMNEGREFEAGPGSVVSLPQGHGRLGCRRRGRRARRLVRRNRLRKAGHHHLIDLSRQEPLLPSLTWGLLALACRYAVLG